MKRKRGILISLLCCCIFLTGCWSYRELTDIGFVLAFGIDEGKEDKYLGTFQIVNPKNAAGGEQGGGMQGPPSTIYQGEGDNLLELNRATTQQTSRRTYFAHTSLVVVGEDVARKGVKDFLDLLTRSQEFRPTADIVIAKDGTAEDLLSTLTPIDQFSTIKIEKHLKCAKLLG